MKAIVIGSGGREHAMAWTLLQSPNVTAVVCIPGNGGTATLPGCSNLAMSVDDVEGIARFALVQNMGLVAIGPEQPLADGVADGLRAEGITVFGPDQAGAQLESSKAWAKALMQEASIPTAASAVFDNGEAATAYVEEQGAPIVIKADGLAAGKGVTVAMTLEEAKEAIAAIFGGQFGAAGSQVVIEEFLTGQEASVLAVTDGITIRPLMPAQDHKQVGEGDTGPNTGGMGAYAPTPVLPPELLDRIQTDVLEPTVQTLRKRGIDYRGVIYAGLMITPDGEPKVIEFNCRFGDPETQVVLPLLDTPLDKIMLACCEQRLDTLPPFEWKSGYAACVVMAAEGYPGKYPKGMVIKGVDVATNTGAMVFHAGTQLEKGVVKSTGGRVLGVTALGAGFEDAIANAYRGVDAIQFENAYYRKDIGHRVRAQF
ncbi:phosphoribosylamine--glycine ligase [Leptothoe spongobia]|uniref:Phosphoribosylamine--glycine ligase n=1 Tax=Leptothoe spongobia TAU-MAC 1115 TaxID=1967444 RepID=A0A947DGN1_9CYAN|nr:phosphoribosylamine--glycine ligase [Leptothoe spongobia]MBT9316712.1 phosphoribosylamine--glycine ligase [Leptothoe spongobia TAU-MAC 1115]